jgi:hypothetical protein
MKDLTHETIIRYLLLCIENGICLNAPNPQDWGRMMGYKGSSHTIAWNVTNAGRKLNAAYGSDVIGKHWPQWVENGKYRAV